MPVFQIQTGTHGRAVVDDADRAPAARLLLAFHGYAQNAEDMLTEVRQIPGISAWRVVSVQALHRFYARGETKVVGSWLTGQEREIGIADNVEYVHRVIDHFDHPPSIVCVGFSQGASMAYRAALMGSHRMLGVVALGGDIPPEVAALERAWPPVLIGAGRGDRWYDQPKLDADLAVLAARGATHEVCRFAGGHEWTDEFRAVAGRWLANRAAE